MEVCNNLLAQKNKSGPPLKKSVILPSAARGARG